MKGGGKQHIFFLKVHPELRVVIETAKHGHTGPFWAWRVWAGWTLRLTRHLSNWDIPDWQIQLWGLQSSPRWTCSSPARAPAPETRKQYKLRYTFYNSHVPFTRKRADRSSKDWHWSLRCSDWTRGATDHVTSCFYRSHTPESATCLLYVNSDL